ncbi:uncharacterized protein LOC136030981 [Artemia franciscana]|uniref:C2H2-type domain-containing protein n=1 Tax=Artemia franciscana TaxID=6661 RepID=A0AA88HAM7_ARTSF|nr:hypothetical protein QYM36_017380 [Artemia franciscana]KAK2705317.1 hypothetical protein QYM36_017380 [Artemia franciscana]KAK2705318.1 hypothetical protein QYM36_017380 [Artemia franciscana]
MIVDDIHLCTSSGNMVVKAMNLECQAEELSAAQLEGYRKELLLYEASQKEIEDILHSAANDYSAVQLQYDLDMHGSVQYKSIITVSTDGMLSGETLKQISSASIHTLDFTSPVQVPTLRSAQEASIKPTRTSRQAAKRKTSTPPVATTPVINIASRAISPIMKPQQGNVVKVNQQTVTTSPATPTKKSTERSSMPISCKSLFKNKALGVPEMPVGTPIGIIGNPRPIKPTTSRNKAQQAAALANSPLPSTMAKSADFTMKNAPVSAQPATSKISTTSPSISSVNVVDDDDEIEVLESKIPAPGKAANSKGAKNESRLFPSLSVTVRPLNYDTPNNAQQARKALDVYLKNKLQLGTAEFAEWLMQEGLIRTTQYCPYHCTTDSSAVPLKLGKASDDGKFPHSGGYVWIGDCCPNSFMAIFNGSIFGGSPHPPATLIKLIYHWCCYTPVANVVKWVNVDHHYLKSFHTLMRSVCTFAVTNDYEQFGTKNGSVEVGIISLGTSSLDGKKKEVRVEVLGVLDQRTKRIRMRAVEPDSSAKKFSKILEPLQQWVHLGAKIYTDFTVERAALNTLGFSKVFQKNPTNVSLLDTQSNATCMDFLKKNIPKIFQTTLSLLSTNMIQQFLDELSWREEWGRNSHQCFKNIIRDIRTLTLADNVDPILTRLARVAANPTGSWAATINAPTATPKRIILSKNQSEAAAVSVNSTPIKQVPTRKRNVDYSAPGPASVKRARTQEMHHLKYFGKCLGKAINIQKTSGFCFQCPISGCPKNFSDNLSFGKHLFSHVDSRVQFSELSDHLQCKYCFKTFGTPYAMQSHVTSQHTDNSKKRMCMICEEDFKEASQLLEHLQNKHSPFEMPYVCEICSYKTSSQRDIVDHFHKDHGGSPFIMCHLCLKTFNVVGEKNAHRMNYIYHMKEHQKPSVARKYSCQKCTLVFLNNVKLTDHQKWHEKIKNPLDVHTFIPFTAEYYPVMDELVKLVAKKQNPDGNSIVAKKFGSLCVKSKDASTSCFECKQPLLDEGHFNSYLYCAHCRFATCCMYAMNAHAALAHGPSAILKEAPESVFKLKQVMYCVCGFQANNGNILERHLNDCGKNKCYTSKQAAGKASQMEKSASFPPLVDLDDGGEEKDADETWMKAIMASSLQKKDQQPVQPAEETEENGGQNMLRMLGLQPKGKANTEKKTEESLGEEAEIVVFD